MKCPECGREISKNKCYFCGNKLSGPDIAFFSYLCACLFLFCAFFIFKHGKFIIFDIIMFIFVIIIGTALFLSRVKKFKM